MTRAIFWPSVQVPALGPFAVFWLRTARLCSRRVPCPQVSRIVRSWRVRLSAKFPAAADFGDIRLVPRRCQWAITPWVSGRNGPRRNPTRSKRSRARRRHRSAATCPWRRGRRKIAVETDDVFACSGHAIRGDVLLKTAEARGKAMRFSRGPQDSRALPHMQPHPIIAGQVVRTPCQNAISSKGFSECLPVELGREAAPERACVHSHSAARVSASRPGIIPTVCPDGNGKREHLHADERVPTPRPSAPCNHKSSAALVSSLSTWKIGDLLLPSDPHGHELTPRAPGS